MAEIVTLRQAVAYEITRLNPGDMFSAHDITKKIRANVHPGGKYIIHGVAINDQGFQEIEHKEVRKHVLYFATHMDLTRENQGRYNVWYIPYVETTYSYSAIRFCCTALIDRFKTIRLKNVQSALKGVRCSVSAYYLMLKDTFYIDDTGFKTYAHVRLLRQE